MCFGMACCQNILFWQHARNMSTFSKAMALYMCSQEGLGLPVSNQGDTMKQLIALLATTAFAVSAFAAEPAKKEEKKADAKPAATAPAKPAGAGAPATPAKSEPAKKDAPKADAKAAGPASK